jgi:hypothetical protein
MPSRPFLAIAIASLFASTSPGPPTPVLGVVTQANIAHIGSSPVSAGTTVYDGDLLATEEGGTLSIRAKQTHLMLGQNSGVTLRKPADGSDGIEADLARGMLTFSTGPTSTLSIHVGNAQVDPVSKEPTVGEVGILQPKELLLRARQGDIQFSYHGESETIRAGESYRVLIDPPADSSVNVARGLDKKKPFHRWFFCIPIAAGIFAGGWQFDHHHHHHPESPDHP